MHELDLWVASLDETEQALWNEVVAAAAADRTNFPRPGDNKAVSFRNSQWRLFPLDYAADLKENYPTIWSRGGNIRGNSQYAKLSAIQKKGGTATSASEIAAMRLREAWVARHYKDFRLPGVIAQIKWLAVGSRGLSYMKQLVNEAKQRAKAGLDGPYQLEEAEAHRIELEERLAQTKARLDALLM